MSIADTDGTFEAADTGKGKRGETVTVQETTRRRGRRRMPVRRYAQAEQQPADPAQATAAFSTGPGEAVEYHYHRVPTYHHQYSQDQAEGAENNPT